MQIFSLSTTFHGCSQCMKWSQDVLIGEPGSVLMCTVKAQGPGAAWQLGLQSKHGAMCLGTQDGSLFTSAHVTSLGLRPLSLQNVFNLSRDYFAKQKENTDKPKG